MTQPFNFTRRQREIAEMIVAGHTRKTLAEHFVISRRTVEGHLACMYRLAHVRSFGELRAALLPLLRDRQPEVSA